MSVVMSVESPDDFMFATSSQGLYIVPFTVITAFPGTLGLFKLVDGTRNTFHAIARTCVALKIRDTFSVEDTELFNPQQRFGEIIMKLTLF